MHSFRSVPCLLDDPTSPVARRCPSHDLLAPAPHGVTNKMARKKRHRAPHAPVAAACNSRRCRSSGVMASLGVEFPVRDARRRRQEPLYEVSEMVPVTLCDPLLFLKCVSDMLSSVNRGSSLVARLYKEWSSTSSQSCRFLSCFVGAIDCVVMSRSLILASRHR